MVTIDESLEAYKHLKEKGKKLEETLKSVTSELKKFDIYDNITFNEFLFIASQNPFLIFRDIFMYYHDMIKYYVPKGFDDYEVTDDSVGFINYNLNDLFVKDCDDPFFADRLFANRFMNLVNALSKGVQNNHIILFEGPPGSGKSTFLNNLLTKFESFSKTEPGVLYKTYWKLDIKSIIGNNTLEKIIAQNDHAVVNYINKSHVEISCPSNDNPILQVPIKYRKAFLEQLVSNAKLRNELFDSKSYKWILKEKPCSICSSIYNVLMDKLGDPVEVLNMLYAKKIKFNRQFGKGITVFNPGDEIIRKPITDQTLQNFINLLFHNDDVKYIFSSLAYTNNGIYALMDIKDNNIERLIALHGIISDGVHKVEHVEEHIKSLFVGLVNPEDKKHYENVKSFQDRIMHVSIPYILDYEAEVKVFENKVGCDINRRFLPGVLQNFAKIIVASRMNTDSDAMKKWLKEYSKYYKYADKNLLLLKMELYKGIVPSWLSEEDKKAFVKSVRKELLIESEYEGNKGISGRQSLSVFNTLLARHNDSRKLITMDDIKVFFLQNEKLYSQLPEGFIESLEDMYDYNILQQIKESLYYFSEKQIVKEILNYLFALNYDIGNTETNFYTNEIVEITEAHFMNFESIILGPFASDSERKVFRKENQKEYISFTLAKEIKLDGKDISQTKQFEYLFDRYISNLKENVLKPYLTNDNLRLAILDYGTTAFKSHSSKICQDVTRLITKLKTKFKYPTQGAAQVCIYAIDKKLQEKFV